MVATRRKVTGAARAREALRADRGGSGRGHWLAIGLLAIVALGIKAPQFVAPMGQDQGLYHTVGQEILRGGVPYRDAWDPKPPGVFYAHAALLSLMADPWRPCRIGSLPGLSHSDLQPRCGTLLFEAVDSVYSIGLGALVFWLARRFGFARGTAAVAFGLTSIFVNLALLDPEGSTPEKYALAPAVGVVLAGLAALESRRSRWLVLAGVLAAVAALFKPPDLASFGALSAVLVALRRWRGLLWLWIPLAAVLLAVWGLFSLVDAGAQLVDATLAYNFGRLGFQSERIPFAALVSAWQVFRDGLALVWLPALIGLALAWQTRRWRLLAVWAVFDVVALFLGGTKFTREYFLQLVPSLGLLAAAALHSLWTAASEWRPRAWLLMSLGAIGLLSSSFQASFTLRVWNEYIANGWTTTSVEHLATMISALPPTETLFVWGDEAQLYTLSGRLPSTRFLNTTGLAANSDASVNQRRSELIASLTSKPPAVLIVDRRTADDDPDGRLKLNVRYFPELQRLLAERYRPMDDAVLRAYLGGDREQVFVRAGSPDLCQQMPDCHLSGP
jgi:hypothetical protein